MNPVQAIEEGKREPAYRVQPNEREIGMAFASRDVIPREERESSLICVYLRASVADFIQNSKPQA